MTKRQESRPVRVTAALFAAALATIGATTVASPAQAAVPAVANTWSTLVYRSLTVTATGVQLRQTLATQRAGVASRTATATEVAAALATAEKQVAAAAADDKAAKTRLAAAQTAWRTARATLAKTKTTDKVAYARAQAAVTATQKTALLRASQARAAASDLSTANAFASAAGASLVKANNAVKVWANAVTSTEQKIASLQTPAALAAQAAALSGDVVTAVRPAFTTADTASVYGTTVHRSLAYGFKRMVDDARKAGIPISGGGFRTKERQIELRRINGCPDVYAAPASSCRVPTAVPGRSLHEIGMAVDITSGGRSLTSASPAFKWLQVHADEYGYKNLPSEPWHWSITGG